MLRNLENFHNRLSKLLRTHVYPSHSQPHVLLPWLVIVLLDDSPASINSRPEPLALLTSMVWPGQPVSTKQRRKSHVYIGHLNVLGPLACYDCVGHAFRPRAVIASSNSVSFVCRLHMAIALYRQLYHSKYHLVHLQRTVIF